MSSRPTTQSVSLEVMQETWMAVTESIGFRMGRTTSRLVARAGECGLIAVATTAWLLLQAPPLRAQAAMPATEDEPASTPPWWPKAALVAGGIGLSMTLDDEVRGWVREHKNGTYETYADIVRPFGEAVVFVPVGVGLLAAGFISGSDGVRDAGARVSASIAVSAVIEGVSKLTIGRYRPGANRGSTAYDPFSKQSSFPSGHSTVAFALAASLSNDIQKTWATIALYSIAVASALARLVDDFHWLSDLAAGAAVGYSSAWLARHRILRPNEGGMALRATPLGLEVVWEAGF